MRQVGCGHLAESPADSAVVLGALRRCGHRGNMEKEIEAGSWSCRSSTGLLWGGGEEKPELLSWQGCAVVRMMSKIFPQGSRNGPELRGGEDQQDTLTVASLVAGEMLANVNIDLYECGLEDNFPAEQNDRNEIFHRVQRRQLVFPILSALLDCLCTCSFSLSNAEYYL